MDIDPLFDLSRSESLLARAKDVAPDVVGRFAEVGGTPPFIVRGEGCRLFDEDGNRYVDLDMGRGGAILGHAAKPIRDAMAEAAARGSMVDLPTLADVELAEMIRTRMPFVEELRFARTDVDAIEGAVRAARVVTGRTRVVTIGRGSDASLFNDLAAVEALMNTRGAEVAALVVDPLGGHSGCVPPAAGFLAGLRSLCDRHGAWLVFDEVLSGFRVARGGCRSVCKVTPDVTCMGALVGGGLPFGVFGGRRDAMRRMVALGDAGASGTTSGNPLAVAGGLAMLRALDATDAWRKLEDAGAYLQAGLENILDSLGIPGHVPREGSMLGLHFAEQPCKTMADVAATDRARFTVFFHGMLRRGVLIPPSPFDCWFLSTAHDDDALDHVLDAARSALRDTMSTAV